MYIRGCGIVITVEAPLRPANQLVHHITEEEAPNRVMYIRGCGIVITVGVPLRPAISVSTSHH